MWVKSIILVVLRTVRTLGAIFIFHAPVNNRLEFPAIKYFYGGEEERKENNHGVTITIRYRARFNDRENRMHEFVFFFVMCVNNRKETNKIEKKIFAEHKKLMATSEVDAKVKYVKIIKMQIFKCNEWFFFSMEKSQHIGQV